MKSLSPYTLNPKRTNILTLGRLSSELDIELSNWKKAIEQTLKPKILDKAFKDFFKGRDLARSTREAIIA